MSFEEISSRFHAWFELKWRQSDRRKVSVRVYKFCVKTHSCTWSVTLIWRAAGLTAEVALEELTSLQRPDGRTLLRTTELCFPVQSAHIMLLILGSTNVIHKPDHRGLQTMLVHTLTNTWVFCRITQQILGDVFPDSLDTVHMLMYSRFTSLFFPCTSRPVSVRSTNRNSA